MPARAEAEPNKRHRQPNPELPVQTEKLQQDREGESDRENVQRGKLER